MSKPPTPPIYDENHKPTGGRPRVLGILTPALYLAFEEVGEIDGYRFAQLYLEGGRHQWKAMHEHPKSFEVIRKWRHDLLIHKENKALQKIEKLLESDDPGVSLRAANQLRSYVKDMRQTLKNPSGMPDHLMITKRNPLLRDITPGGLQLPKPEDAANILDLEAEDLDDDLERLGLKGLQTTHGDPEGLLDALEDSSSSEEG